MIFLTEMFVKPYRGAMLQLIIALSILVSLVSSAIDKDVVHTQMQSFDDNTIESHKTMDCGSIASNVTGIIIKNPHYPEPTYTKSICETVIERAHPSIKKLSIKFKQLELYRSTFDGQCLHDRFAVYTDLNAAMTPVLCGNQTGKVVTIPFSPPLTSLIVSITTSDLDHDRIWIIKMEQEP